MHCRQAHINVTTPNLFIRPSRLANSRWEYKANHRAENFAQEFKRPAFLRSFMERERYQPSRKSHASEDYPAFRYSSIMESEREERRAKREARRAKQRLENVTRAKQMHAARISGMYSASIRIRSPATFEKREIHIGCSGWYYWHWKDLFYPANIPRQQWFSHYCRKFKTVELNAPFYSWPTIATVKTWLRQVGLKRFLYTVKVSELITHTKRFTGTKTLIQDFGLIADILGSHMGCFLFQLPPSFHYTATRLKSIVGQLDPRRKNVVEFRHKSWWNETVFQAFREAGITFCSCSGPRLPDELVQTAEDVYIRFHGTKQWYRHDYTQEELSLWSDRIHACAAKRVWVYFNNDRDGFAIKNAQRLAKLLRSGRSAA